MTLATRNTIFFTIACLASTLFLQYFIGNGDKELVVEGEGEEMVMTTMFTVVEVVRFMSVVGLIVSVFYVIASTLKKRFAVREGREGQ
jgi:hypothetical protein